MTSPTKGLVERLDKLAADVRDLDTIVSTSYGAETIKEAATAIRQLTQELKTVTDTLAYLQGEDWETIKVARKTLSKYQPEDK